VFFVKEWLMSKSCWLLSAALMFGAVLPGARAAELLLDADSGADETTQTSVAAKPAPATDYWLGIECFHASPSLRAQLNLPTKQGLLVVAVVAESPAAKCGIVPNDVLLRAADKPLVEPRDLVQALEATKTGKLKLDLIRGGKPKTVEATPTKRPADAGRPAATPNPSDRETMERWLEGMMSEGDGVRPGMRFRFLHPGAIVPADVFVAPPLPANMSIVISKEGVQPVKIVVKRGDEKWEVTEKELDKLPADVRPHVERMLGHHLFGMVMPDGAMPPSAQAQSPGTAAPQGVNAGVWERLEKRFDEMNGRMDKVMKELEEMHGAHGPQKPAER
jgi:hypothetical protein